MRALVGAELPPLGVRVNNTIDTGTGEARINMNKKNIHVVVLSIYSHVSSTLMRRSFAVGFVSVSQYMDELR
ncbi:hypothetical protein F2P81_024796 [Scophthalmus maximus]|uniref:Uncharacterized protein n=1 Tax=Scophthalmus maximus TaxID=52904 RepID=A0A6A4RRN5_SCOMX|nr:hypothetical protein F2P81_024796 [Scophthalmus maximus]